MSNGAIAILICVGIRLVILIIQCIAEGISNRRAKKRAKRREQLKWMYSQFD